MAVPAVTCRNDADAQRSSPSAGGAVKLDPSLRQDAAPIGDVDGHRKPHGAAGAGPVHRAARAADHYRGSVRACLRYGPGTPDVVAMRSREPNVEGQAASTWWRWRGGPPAWPRTGSSSAKSAAPKSPPVERLQVGHRRQLQHNSRLHQRRTHLNGLRRAGTYDPQAANALFTNARS